jgi:hypothetical protein
VPSASAYPTQVLLGMSCPSLTVNSPPDPMLNTDHSVGVSFEMVSAEGLVRSTRFRRPFVPDRPAWCVVSPEWSESVFSYLDVKNFPPTLADSRAPLNPAIFPPLELR